MKFIAKNWWRFLFLPFRIIFIVSGWVIENLGLVLQELGNSLPGLKRV